MLEAVVWASPGCSGLGGIRGWKFNFKKSTGAIICSCCFTSQAVFEAGFETIRGLQLNRKLNRCKVLAFLVGIFSNAGGLVRGDFPLFPAVQDIRFGPIRGCSAQCWRLELDRFGEAQCCAVLEVRFGAIRSGAIVSS